MAGKEYTTHCGTCGCPREERTKGCTQCNNRHNTWKARGDIRYKAPAPIKCVKCGIDVAEINPSCSRCLVRQKVRKAKSEKEVDPSEFRSVELTKQYYDKWVAARRERIARNKRLLAAGRRPIA